MKYYEEKIPTDGYPFNIFTCETDKIQTIVDPHVHNYIELIYCLCGDYNFILSDGQQRVRAGDFVILPSHEVHCIRSRSNIAGEYIVAMFDPALLYSGATGVPELRFIIPFSINSGTVAKYLPASLVSETEIPSLMKMMLREFTERGFGFELAVHTAVCRLYLWILRYWQSNGMLELPKEIAAGENTVRTMRLVFRYIDANFDTDITLSDIAENCNLSYSYISRLFRSTTGACFSDYLQRVRISAAEKLLATTDKSITEIAGACGFASSSYFTSRFRQHTGSSPREYRARFPQ